MKKGSWLALGITTIAVGTVVGLANLLHQELFVNRIEDYRMALRETKAEIRLMLTPTENIKNGLVKKTTEYKLPVTHTSWDIEHGFWGATRRKIVTGTEFRYRVLEIEDPENPKKQIQLVCPRTSLFKFEVGERYNFKYRPDDNGSITPGEIIAFGTRPVLDPRRTGNGRFFKYELMPLQPDSFRGDGIITPVALAMMDEEKEQRTFK